MNLKQIPFFMFLIIHLISCSTHDNIPRGRIIVIGLDALDLKILHELVSQNRLPAFKHLLENGAHGELQSYHPLLSPLIWTTIATGRPPDEHGILDFTSLDQNGTPIIVPSSQRKCAAVWNIVSARGRSCSVAGWIATWPAENILGTMVSDRFVPSSFVQEQTLLENIIPQLTFPEKLAFPLSDFRQDYTRIGCPELRPYLRLREADCQQSLASPFTVYDRIQHFRLILSRTETSMAVLLDLVDHHPTDLTLAYFDATDSTAHLFMQERPPRRSQVTEEDFACFSNAVDAIYERMDRLVNDVLGRLNERDTLVVLSDHGFRSGEERLKRSSLTTMGPAVSWHREKGVLLARGPSIQPGEIQDASVFDIAPTLLAMLDIPPSLEMPGKILPEFIGGKAQAESFVRVPDWDGDYHPPELPRVDSAYSGLDLEQLQALGYAAADVKQKSEGHGENVNDHYNLSVYYEYQGEYDRALQEIERALSLDPSHRKALGTRCRLLTQLHQFEKAEAEIVRLTAIMKREIADAESELAGHPTGDPTQNALLHARIEAGKMGLSELYHNQGELEFQRGAAEKAVLCFMQSSELDPDNMETLYNLGTCYGMTGQYDKSVEKLTDLLKLNPHHQKGRQSLAVAYLRLQRGALALSLLESLVLEIPNDANIHYLMGEGYRTEQNAEKARECYEKALKIDPNLNKARQRLEQFNKANTQ
ncbi:MAG: tetratricopeptide repeat protein [bacterium]